MRSAAVSRWYRPLELFYGARYYGYEIDMWSVGCIVGELLQGKSIWCVIFKKKSQCALLLFLFSKSILQVPY